MIESVQALQAISVSQQVAANNVANVNTDEFRPSRVEYETGPGDQGVRVQEIMQNTSPAPLVEEYAATYDELRYEEMLLDASSTDLATEMVQMIENEQAFAANVAALHTSLDMTGVLIDMMV